MVFPDSNPKESKFLILYGNKYYEGGFEWRVNLFDLQNRKNELLEENSDNYIIFAGEIAILKDLTNYEK